MLNLKQGDEVCMLQDGELVFGTLERFTMADQKWSVKWLHDPKLYVPNVVPENKLILTDRMLYKGCKVRSVTDRNKIGICRSILFKADLRVIGTNTIIPNVNIDEFAHLKEYKQKSVVCYNGWLGVITAVEREALVHQGDKESFQKLEKLIPTGALAVEQPWIQEQVDNPACHIAPKVSSSPLDEAKRFKRSNFIKDLKVVSVKVHWSHQVDISYPDKPRQEFKNYEVLTLVKEELSSDSSFHHIGNLGRYMVTNATEYTRWDAWQKNFVLKEKLKFELEKKEDLDTYWRAYDLKLYESADGKGGLEQMQTGQKLVVEITHLQGTAGVQWAEDTTLEYLSSLDLQVVEESLLDNMALVPGDFLTCCPSKIKKFKHSNYYSVLLLNQEKDKQLVLRVIDSEKPGRILEDRMVFESGSVERHPIYQCFNESNTIVVVYEGSGDGDEISKIRVGHCLGTNLQGKVNVRFVDTRKEEWVWPQGCAIYSVKGYDLECIRSQIMDKDSNETTFRRACEMLRKVENVWKNPSKSETVRRDALHDLKIFVATFQTLSNSSNFILDLTIYCDATDLLATHTDLRGDQELINLILKCVQDLMSQSEKFLLELTKQDRNTSGDSVRGLKGTNEEEPMDIVEEYVQEDDLTRMFSKPVGLLDSHPTGHHFAQTTKFEPQHQKYFIKVVKDELDRLIKNTSNGSSSSIITKAFSDRMDLLSILIRGPEGTPYENSVYLFDAVLPPNYPAVPPKFHFHSFKAGRLNPNLYAEGKVCVSLLGTWAGNDPREKWTKESNIFQVIISIQGLILVNEPYHNEPGLEAERASAADNRTRCLAYNQQLMPIVFKMIMNQITMPLAPWEVEIQIFYKHQAGILIARWKKWLSKTNENDLPAQERPGFAIYPMSSAFVGLMKGLVGSLEKVVADNM